MMTAQNLSPINDYRVLVVDDDPAILRILHDKLQRAGFTIHTAMNGAEALRRIEIFGLPHLAIVDIDMPQMNGFEFCRRVQRYTDLPVIFLSVIDREEVLVEGIERYAEDYVLKPFSPRELVARVRRVLRRVGDFAYTLAPQIPVDEHLTVDFVEQRVSLDGKPASLTPTETKILYILMRNAGRFVSNDFLLRRLWPLEEIFEDALRVHVHRLRKKIEPQPAQPRYVLTERGMGYAFPSEHRHHHRR